MKTDNLEERKNLKNEFLDRWPIEAVEKMTLEEYSSVVDVSDDTFTYWLETRSKEVMGIKGGSSYKFGIFKGKSDSKSPLKNEGTYKTDGEYRWLHKYGVTKEKAFAKIKDNILQIINAAKENEFIKIDDIDIGPVVKWKIAYLYDPADSLLCLASSEALYYIEEKYLDTSNKIISEIHRCLREKKPHNENIIEYSARLLGEYNNSAITIIKERKKRFSEWARNESSKKIKNTQTLVHYIKCLDEDIPNKLNELDPNSDKLLSLFETIDIEWLKELYKKLGLNGSLYKFSKDFANANGRPSAAVGKYIAYLKHEGIIGDDKDKQVEEKDESGDEMDDMNIPLNKILYGPPGTGKTYSVVEEAVGIIEKVPVSGDRNKIKSKFDGYVANGQIAVVTFHQSYGYEEFVEGIKAVTDDNGEMKYRPEDGVFKRIATKALNNYKATNKVDNKDHQFDILWKRLLEKIIKSNDDSNDEPEMKYPLTPKVYISAIDNDDRLRYKGNSWNALIKRENIRKLYLRGIKERAEVENYGDIDPLARYHASYTVALLKKIYEIEKEGKDIPRSNESLNKYVLIIDEINRGNISKIFGELITLIEDSKRYGADEALSITLPYTGETGETGEEFSIPQNLYILGTMNTADRSIALMDTALRRRFEFKEMMPQPDLLKGQEVEGIDMEKMLITLNERIEYLYDRDHTIGHAYFMSVESKKRLDKKRLDSIFRNKIIPLLQEYFYDDWEKIQMVLGDHQGQKESNDDKFIIASKKKEGSVLGFNHSDITDEQYSYEINSSFSVKAYMKLTRMNDYQE